jgi:undecaprenyl-diphosphatase
MDTIIVDLAKYLYLVVAALAFVFWLRLPKPDKWRFLVAGIIGGIIAVILVKAGGMLYNDPRPFVNSGVKPLFPHVADNGFPSDHTTLTVLLSALVFSYSRKWGVALFLLALIVGVSRMLAHIHHGVDIAAGVGFGIIAALAGIWATNYILDRTKPRTQQEAK